MGESWGRKKVGALRLRVGDAPQSVREVGAKMEFEF